MKDEINESVYDINMDKLCQNSIELIKYARNITAKQVNNVQIMTYYSLGRWIVEVQQQGKHRAEYGKKIRGIIRMCEQVAASGNTLILYSA